MFLIFISCVAVFALPQLLDHRRAHFRGGVDPVVAATVLMLHMNGEDNGTTFIDATERHTPSRTNAVTKTGIKKFGSAGGYFAGNGYVTIPDSTDFVFGTGDLTIETWAYFIDVTGSQQIYSQATADGDHTALSFWYSEADYGTPSLAVDAWEGGRQAAFHAHWTASANTWYHIVLERHGSDCLIFVDGVAQTVTQVTPWGTLANVTRDIYIGKSGYDPSPNYFKGYMDEYRVVKGLAVWTANFTPPTSEYLP